MITKSLKLAVLAGASALLTGCGDSSVELVKTGTFNSYPQMTIDAAFQNAFDNGTWTSEDKVGKKTVSFTGNISQNLHNTLMNNDNVYKYLKRTNVKNLMETAERMQDQGFAKEYKNALASIDTQEIDKVKAEYKKYTSAVNEKNEAHEKELKKLKYDRTMLKHENNGYHVPDDVQKRLKEMDTGISKLRDEHDKDLKDFEAKNKTRNDELNKRFSELSNIKRSKEDAVHKKYLDKYCAEYISPANSIVNFEWVVYPDGTRFELLSFGNDSWQREGTTLEQVLKAIYSM